MAFKYDPFTGKLVPVIDVTEYQADTKEPTGITSQAETTLSTSVSAGAGGTVTLAKVGADFTFYISGKKYYKTANEVFSIPAATGLYFCKYDNIGSPDVSTTPWNLLTDVPVALLYYNNTTGDRFLGEERHGITMDGATHLRLHCGGGAIYYSGFGASGFQENSDLLDDIQIAIDAGAFGDEDITLTPALKLETAKFDKWYRSGATGDWRKDTGDTIPAFHAGNIAKINTDPGGGWQLTDVSNGNYFNCYIFATNSYESANRFILIPSQYQYATSAEAEQESVNSLDFGDFPTVENIPIYKVLLRYRTVNNNNAARVTIIELEDLRGTSNPGVAASGNIHNSLGGRADPEAHPTTAISYPSTLGVTAISSLQDYINYDESAGAISGGEITAVTPATPSVDVSAVDVHLRATASKTGTLGLYNIAAETKTLVADDINYIYADYNAGTPVWAVNQDLTTINAQDKVAVAVAASAHGEIHYLNFGDYTVDFMAEYAKKEAVTNWLQHGEGAEISETGTRNIGLTAGSFYIINKRFTTSAFDTSVSGSFDTLYTSDSGSTWTMTSSVTQLPNTQYNNISTGLVDLDNNKYGIYWVYLIVNSPDHIHVVYGQNQYADLASAKAAKVPTVLPSELAPYGVAVLVGRIIFQKGATNFADVSSPFQIVFTSSTATIHNGLSGLQGGTVGEYYHLTAANHSNLTGGAPSFATSVTSPLFDSIGTTLNIGTTTATTINIGQAGATVNIYGAVNNINATNVSVPSDLDVGGILKTDFIRASSASATVTFQNSGGTTTATLTDAGNFAATGTVSGTSLTGSTYTSGRIPKFSTGGLLADSGLIIDASDNVSGMGTLSCGAITSTANMSDASTSVASTAHFKAITDTTVNTTGITSLFLPTSTLANYGVSVNANRKGTSGAPTFSVRVHNGSDIGAEIGTADVNGDWTLGTLVTGSSSAFAIKSTQAGSSGVMVVGTKIGSSLSITAGSTYSFSIATGANTVPGLLVIHHTSTGASAVVHVGGSSTVVILSQTSTEFITSGTPSNQIKITYSSTNSTVTLENGYAVTRGFYITTYGAEV